MKFRPGDLPQGDPTEPETPVEWADNWLSNTFAWASYTFVPKWCNDEEHWTAKVTQYLFTDCPCCLAFRGVFVGIFVGFFLALIAALILSAALYWSHK